jgi:hypothetical protein
LPLEMRCALKNRFLTATLTMYSKFDSTGNGVAWLDWGEVKQEIVVVSRWFSCFLHSADGKADGPYLGASIKQSD